MFIVKEKKEKEGSEEREMKRRMYGIMMIMRGMMEEVQYHHSQEEINR